MSSARESQSTRSTPKKRTKAASARVRMKDVERKLSKALEFVRTR